MKQTRRNILLVLTILYVLTISLVLSLAAYIQIRGDLLENEKLLENYYFTITEKSEELSPRGNPQTEDHYMGEVRVVLFENDTCVSDDVDQETMVVAETILELDEKSGTYQHYQYVVMPVSDAGVAVCFLSLENIYGEWKKEVGVLAAIFGVSVLLWMLFLWPLSTWLLKPAKDAMEKQKEFLMMAGHELKTPLTVMETSLRMLEQQGIRGKYLDYSLEENKKMTELVEEIIEVASLETEGKQGVVLEEQELLGLLEGAVLPFEAMAYEKGVSLEVSQEEKIYGKTHGAKLQELIGIFVDNGIHHTEPGGKVCVETIPVKDHKIRISVKNQGEPIPTEEQKKIFEKFYRVDKARNRKEGRFGLGLSIAKNLAEELKGNIGVSCENGWTVFYIEIPKA